MKNFDTINILDIDVLNITMQETLACIDEIIATDRKEEFYFVNADCFNKAFKDDHYKKTLQTTKFILGDGSGVRYAANILNNPIVDNVNGTDLLPLLCQECEKNKRSLFLLGAKPDIAKQMQGNLLTKYPNLQIVGEHHGYFDRQKESDVIIDKINSSKANILLVAFGAPFQESWISENYPKINCNVLMGVGGLFDFYSGNI
ncbi:MAG: WecB/TagA/CpsF family glycosyltransferase, partial [Candidatus Cloacimonetes bacterium]|nr:WecB/TagA/CpsF family glycosyltransferase [Candidatus Cloacimonadota bacterium]